MKRLSFFVVLLSVLMLTACGRSSKSTSVQHPAFSADSAYRYIEAQLAYGPRIPNTKPHRMCAAYLAQQFRQFGAEVMVQQGKKINFAGEEVDVLNIVAHFSGDEGAEAILLCAHYDTRPWADEEEVYENRMQPILGANDGASGVGVLLEIARQIGLKRDSAGAGHTPIDIVLFDYEDMGTPDFYTGMQRENTWCLGSQFWSEEFAYSPNHMGANKYEYGILLDMVGAPGATFPKEYYSTQGAKDYVEKIWRNATKLGYQNYFVSTKSAPIVDDHYYVGSIAGIPCVDIIHYDAQTGVFPFWWHTLQDDLRNIDKQTLQAVGETVLLCLNY